MGSNAILMYNIIVLPNVLTLEKLVVGEGRSIVVISLEEGQQYLDNPWVAEFYIILCYLESCKNTVFQSYHYKSKVIVTSEYTIITKITLYEKYN